MKIRAITSANLNGLKYPVVVQQTKDNTLTASYLDNIDDLSIMPCYFPFSFTGIQNSSKLRILFGYKLPCMYCGIPMIDPKMLGRWTKNRVFNRSAAEVLEILTPHKDSFIGVEAKVLEIIAERAKVQPEKTIRDILQELRPVYSRRLRKKQTPIFRQLLEISHELPQRYQHKVRFLMQETIKKLNDKPVVIPFSSYEFKYKLSKIKDDIANGSDVKSKKVMNKLIKESKRFSNTTSANTIENQKKVLNFLDIILKKSVLKDNYQLRSLIEVSKLRLNKEEILVPFTRKSFIYDIAKLIEDLPDKNLQEKILNIAQTLPTSQESVSAYILKIANEQPDKIGHRLIWPSLASVEHILPRSCGGADVMANFGGATTRENSKRKSIEFVRQLKLCPLTPKYCQMYVDRLIELYHQGVFARHNINAKYITDFANTIYTQSKHRVKLDTSALWGKSMSARST